MTQREQHLIKEQEAKRKGARKAKPKLKKPNNEKSFFLQWKEAIDDIKLNGYKEDKEGSEEA